MSLQSMSSIVRSRGRQALIGAYAVGVTSAGIDRRRLRRVARSQGLVVLNLHNVARPLGGSVVRSRLRCSTIWSPGSRRCAT